MIDSVKRTITLTVEKKLSIYTLYQNILSNYNTTIGEIAQTIGVIVSSLRPVPYGQMYYGGVEVWGGTDQVTEIGVRWYCRQNKFP